MPSDSTTAKSLKLSPDSVEQLPATPGPSRAWAGANTTRAGKRYVDAPLGQLHIREAGPKACLVPLLLLHQSPSCMVEFGAVQNALATWGVRSIIADTPGYGMSDHPEVLPSMGGLADNLVALLDALDIEKAVVGGHHTGACISTALAARHPRRVAGVILHGCPLYSAEEARQFRDGKEWDRTPVRDGSHMSQLFKWEGVGDEGDLLNRTWMSAAMFFQGPDIGHWAVNRYDMGADLARISAPGLIISEVDDVTFHRDQRALALRPDFSHRLIRDPGTSSIMSRPATWAAIALDFLRLLGLQPS